MNATWNRRFAFLLVLFSLTAAVPAARAQYWVSFAEDTRYLALGDSITAGYGAHPATQGFAYRLYQQGAIDTINRTLFCNMGVPNATSLDVLQYQVPQVGLFFKETGENYRKVVTLTVGGNDMLTVLAGANPQVVLGNLGFNLAGILGGLLSQSPDARIYVANQYDPRLPVPGGEQLVAALNMVLADVVGMFAPNAVLVDVFSAFEGRNGLLLIEKKGGDLFQVHPTDAGYRVMAAAFADAMMEQ